MSGLPASGKSTLGREISAALGLDVLDKDDLLEALFAEHDGVDSALRSALSRRADDALEHAARACDGAVLVSFWRRRELSVTSGTPTEWLRDLGEVVEVHCVCNVDTAAARFLSRRRHPAHGDATKDTSAITVQFEALAALGPLGVGRTIVVDTGHTVDVAALVHEIG